MEEKLKKRLRRHKRIRRRIVGTEARPRFCVYRGLANIHAQLIDDINEKTLLSVSSEDKSFKKELAYGGNAKAAQMLGELLAEKAKKKGITEVIFGWSLKLQLEADVHEGIDCLKQVGADKRR